jgi:hypothetical protein
MVKRAYGCLISGLVMILSCTAFESVGRDAFFNHGRKKGGINGKGDCTHSSTLYICTALGFPLRSYPALYLLECEG